YHNEIVFVGSYYRNRAEVLEKICDFDLGVLGPGWDKVSDDSPLKKCVRKSGNINVAEWLKIFASAKIVVMVHYHDSAVACFQASPKVFEILAAGKFLVVDAQPDVLTLFRDKEDLAVFRDISQLRNILLYYLSNQEEREAIAVRGREKVLNQHTYYHRIKAMMEILCQD
ncbi:MAG: glycosyltransferase, partial [Candidatus Omnitrophica bacterium]|nr:glycosyltransferase [Candidatus Omnitrophota bacterium]